jgi:predicted nuclease of predicted toxin-antitoxin system
VRLLLDETLGRSVAAVLRDRGHDVTRSSQAGGPGLSDEELVETAVSEDRVLVTLDEGFADTVRFDPSGTPGIVVVSLPDEASSDGGELFVRIDAAMADVHGSMQSAVNDARRAVVDLATERHRLEREIAQLVERKAGLRMRAADARAAGEEGDLRAALDAVATIEAQRERLMARRASVASQQSDAQAVAEDLARRVQAARTQYVLDRAQLLIDTAGVDSGTLPPPAPAGDHAEAKNVPDLDEVHPPARSVDVEAAEARASEYRTFEQLVPVWGSLARELAGALTQLLAALETSDPRGLVWFAGVDGVRQRRDSE